MDEDSARLDGVRILLVEDQHLIAEDMQRMATELGADVVGPVASIEEAKALLLRTPPDLAVLDVNLRRKLVFPLARNLKDQRVPIVFATGYDNPTLSKDYRDHPRLEKPITAARLLAVAAQVGVHRSKGGVTANAGIAQVRNPRPLTVAFRRLEAFQDLKAHDRAMLNDAAPGRERRAASHELHNEHTPLLRPWILVAGWACRQRLLSDGRRQIFDFLLPGDIVGAADPTAPLCRPTITALTPVEIADATFLAVAAQKPEHEAVAKALRLIADNEASRLMDHVVRLGRQTALERIAHLLLELNQRLQLVGMAAGGRFSLPLTQEMLADNLGLSAVHVNRMLQQLRRERLIMTRDGAVTLLEQPRLEQIADFNHGRRVAE